ncbi:uncharacterized protein LOC110248318 [Exaiptasia diaphana]|uniref:Uncharacterized protein n=1 Tax=Exaiptasia diaphana TaxID=2652724 RepID=A0A913YUK8_EXADI|nr:uncharacterized protein LOC110248318 [Exaiptasia diaphana]
MSNVNNMTDKLQAQLKVAENAFERSDDYHFIRPIYTVESVEYLLKEVGALSSGRNAITILELGCGTGLFTKTATGVLEEATAASYHWFANQQAYREMYRVLEPNGMLGFITNLPSEIDSPQWMLDAYKLVHQAYEKTQVPFEHDWKWKKVLENSGYFCKVKSHLQFKNFQKLTQSQCVKHFLSYGGVITASNDDKDAFEKQFHDILNKNFSNNGKEFDGVNHTVEIYTSKSKKTMME